MNSTDLILSDILVRLERIEGAVVTADEVGKLVGVVEDLVRRVEVLERVINGDKSIQFN